MVSQFDHCVYFCKLPNGSFIYLLLYVDDMLIASKRKVEINKLKTQLNKTFEMKDLGEAKKILGMEIKRDEANGTLWMSQTAKAMVDIPYANVVGALIYAMVCTRSDISHTSSMVSRYMHDLGKEHWMAVKWIMRYIQGTVNIGLKYQRDEKLGHLLVGYVNSDYARDLDKRRSTTRCINYGWWTRTLAIYIVVDNCLVYYKSRAYGGQKSFQGSYLASWFDK